MLQDEKEDVTLGKFIFLPLQILSMLSSLYSPAADKVHFMNFCLNYEECKVPLEPKISQRTFSTTCISPVCISTATAGVAEGKFPRKSHKGNSPQNSLIYLRLAQLRGRGGGIINRFSTIDVSIF